MPALYLTESVASDRAGYGGVLGLASLVKISEKLDNFPMVSQVELCI